MEAIFKSQIDMLLHQLKHPNLAETVGWSLEDGGKWALVFELMEGGSLSRRWWSDSTLPQLRGRER